MKKQTLRHRHRQTDWPTNQQTNIERLPPPPQGSCTSNRKPKSDETTSRWITFLFISIITFHFPSWSNYWPENLGKGIEQKRERGGEGGGWRGSVFQTITSQTHTHTTLRGDVKSGRFGRYIQTRGMGSGQNHNYLWKNYHFFVFDSNLIQKLSKNIILSAVWPCFFDYQRLVVQLWHCVKTHQFCYLR